MLDVVAFLLLKPVTKFLSRKIFGDSTLGNDLAGSAIDYAKDKFGDFRKAQEASRKIEDLASSMVKQLADFAEYEHLDPQRAEQIAKDILSACTVLDLGNEIAKAGRQPAPLAKAIAEALPAAADKSDEQTGMMVVAFAHGLCQIAGSLPEYERGKDQKLFGELDILIAGQLSLGSDLSSLRVELSAIKREWTNERQSRLAAADQNETQYRSALHQFASQVKLLGLEGDRHETGRALPIETAYVPLRLRARDTSQTLHQDDELDWDDNFGDADETDITWPEILEHLHYFDNRLLVEGIGGSGKTTLLQWTAVQALRAEGSGSAQTQASSIIERLKKFRKRGILDIADPLRFDAPDNKPSLPWFKRVPLFIRLRDCPNGRLPPPQDLPSRIANTALGTSEEWVRTVVNEGRALFLIDGIDEVPDESRDSLSADIEAYLRDYSGCALIATSRPTAVQDLQWSRLFGSCRVSVERMAKPEIEAFVKHWYKSYGIVRGESCNDSAVARLLGQIEARVGLIGLMDTPLLAASICFLNKDRTEELPTRAPELYGQLCRQLVHQLDEERLKKSGYDALVPALRGLAPDQKLYLLSELAQLMINNRCATLEMDQALPCIKHGLRTIGHDHGRNPQDVLDALQERSGLLRGSTLRTVEFAHNNLRGWLAAYAFAQDSEHVLPVERAFDLMDFDLPVLAAFHSNKSYRHRLIDACLRFADSSPPNKRVATIMALRCGRAGAIDPSYRSKLDEIAYHILPPRNADEATWLAELGEAIVPQLAAGPDRDASEDAACVRCLRLIGVNTCIDTILGYLQYRNTEVVDELAQALPPLSVPQLLDYVLLKMVPDRPAVGYYPARHVTSRDIALALRDLGMPNALCLNNTDIEDLDFLHGIEHLQTLLIDNTQISDLGPLGRLTGIQNLSFNNTGVSDLKPLGGLAALQTLSFNSTKVSDLEPLSGLTALRTLSLDSTKVSDLEPLSGLTALRTLSFDHTNVADLEPLRDFAALDHLSFIGTPVANLMPLSRLTGLRTLSFDHTNVTDVEPLRDFAVLNRVSFSGTPVTDLEPLRGLSELQILLFGDTHVADLDPLRGLIALNELSFDDTQVADLEPLRELVALRSLSFDTTPVADLGPLRALVALKSLSFDTTPVADLGPLRELVALRSLSFDNTPVADIDPLGGLIALRYLSMDDTNVSVRQRPLA